MIKIDPPQVQELDLIPFCSKDFKPFSYINRIGPTHYTLVDQEDGWQEVKYFIEKKLDRIR